MKNSDLCIASARRPHLPGDNARLGRRSGKAGYIFGLPVLTPRLSSYWVVTATNVPAAVARPLIDGLADETERLDDHVLSPHPRPGDRPSRPVRQLLGTMKEG